MKYFYLKGKIDKTIKITKLGIEIRNIKDSDKKKIIEEYDYLKENKNFIDTLMNSYVSLSEYKNKIDPKMINIIQNLIVKMIKNKTPYTFKDNIEKYLNDILIIQVDNKLNKFFCDDELIPFVQKIIGLSEINSSKMIKNRLTLDNKILMICDYPEIEILTDFLTTGDISNLYIIDKEKYIFLNRISYFISNLDSKDIEGFINIIELVYLDHKTNQNCIINNVLSIESLILSDTNNIEKSFVLKSGIILKYSDFPISNDEIKYILNFIYNIRSDIVHGNYFKIEADFDRLKSKVPNCKDILDGSNTIYSKEKDLPYAIANVYSNILLFSIIKYWIFNQDKLDFIKHN